MPISSKIKLFPILAVILFTLHCGDSSVTTIPTPPIVGDLTLNAVSLGDDCPPDIDISNQSGLKDTLFVTTYSPPGVVGFDLNTNPLVVSKTFAGLTLPANISVGAPNSLELIDDAHAFLLTSNTMVYFNPKEGSIYEMMDVTGEMDLIAPLAQVDGEGQVQDGVSGPFSPTFPASLVKVGSRVAVSFSNLIFPSNHVQGLIRFYDLHDSPPFLTPATPVYTVTSGFNATALTPLSDGTVLATSTGATKFEGSGSVPTTEAFLDRFDLKSGEKIDSVSLGFTAPTFWKWAVTADETSAFVGSSSGGFLLEVKLKPNLEVVQGANNPLVITSKDLGSDYLTNALLGHDDGALFVGSFNRSGVYFLDRTVNPISLLPSPLLFDPSNDGIIDYGVGGLVLRAGKGGVDFTGPDLFVLTCHPGTIAAVKTY